MGDDSQTDDRRRTRRARIRQNPLITALMLVVAGGIAVLDLFVLEGEPVFDKRLDSSRNVRVEIPLQQAGEPHLLYVQTRREARLTLTLAAPTGEVVAEFDELARHKRHYLDFTPPVAGTYVLEGTSSRRSSSLSSPRVRVFVNDHRWFGPLCYSLGF